jgi:hypothetical protein
VVVRPFTGRIVSAAFVTGVALTLASTREADASQGPAAEPRLEISGLGPVPLPLTIPGAALFIFPGDMISGTLSRLPYQAGVVQVISRNAGTWTATMAATDVVRRRGNTGVSWTIPASDLGCDAHQEPTAELIAVFARHRLPPGPVDPAIWADLVRSQPMVLSCAHFNRSNLEVIEVGYTQTRPRSPPRVSHYEDVRVSLDHVPYGSIVQLCVQPVESSVVWCQEVASPSTGSDWRGTVYVGRPSIRQGPAGLEFLDQYQRFWIKALIVRMPLPVHPTRGIAPDEWIALKPQIVRESAPVEVIRGFRPGQVRLIVTRLGQTTDGRIRLADRVSRVEGLFRPLPGYQPTGKEVVTLLVRRRNDKTWAVAGKASRPGDLTTWLITAADLDPYERQSHDERVAIAVLTLRPLSPPDAITEQLLNTYAKSISDEVPFALFDRGR